MQNINTIKLEEPQKVLLVLREQEIQCQGDGASYHLTDTGQVHVLSHPN